jgi:hypothetical protein
MKLWPVSDTIKGIKSSLKRLAGNLVRKKDMGILHKITVEKPEGKIPFKKHIRTKQDIIKMYYRDIQRHGVTWIRLALNKDKRQDLTNMLMSVRVTFRANNFFTTSATVGFSKRTPLHGMSRIRRKTAFVYKQYVCNTFVHRKITATTKK